jgi:hypothetical protein
VLLLDGLSVESQAHGASRLLVGGHVGVPTHLFESSPSGDFAAGAHLDAEPWRGGRLRFDYMHVDDRRRFADHDDDLLGLAVWQRVGAAAQVHARWTRLEGRDRDLRVRAHGGLGELGGAELVLRLQYDELFETQGALASEFDPFNQALLAYHPYRQLSASLTQTVDRHLAWDLGVTLRRLARDRDAGQFNRDFDRGNLALHVTDVFGAGSTLSLSADAYETGGRDTAAVGIDYRARLGDDVELTAGSLYALYKYDFVTQVERDRVRTWFGGLRYRVDRHLRVALDYSYETGEFPDSHSAEARMTWRF